MIKLSELDESTIIIFGGEAHSVKDVRDILNNLDGWTPVDTPAYMIERVEKDFVKVNIENYIEEQCADGYEDMIDRFDFNDHRIKKAQKLINEYLESYSYDNIVYIANTDNPIDLLS